MTKQELNRDVKRLYKKVQNSNGYNDSPEIVKEFKRLYLADTTAEYLTYTSFKMMYRLNMRLRIIPLHQMFINIKI